MPSTQGKQTCPRNHANKLAEKCVAKYITAKSCKAAVGIWKKFTTNYVEKTAGTLSTCHDQGDMKLARGVPYEPHKLSQGADQKKQFVLLQKRPDVIYAPSTVVNHNGINMEASFLLTSRKFLVFQPTQHNAAFYVLGKWYVSRFQY